jgi:large subunit ribosomal protein L25
MTTKLQLNAKLITAVDGNPRKIRTSGFIPAVVYGFGVANKNIMVKKHDFAKAFAIAGEFNLLDLAIDGDKTVKAIVKEVQKDHLSNGIIHIDFYQVDMHKKITTEIPLNFIGESKAVKELGGTLVKNMDAVKVNCLPGDLVSHIDIDLSRLESFDQFIRLHDLTLPSGLELVSATNEAVVGVVETKVEVETVKSAETAPVEGAAGEPIKENETAGAAKEEADKK